MAIISKNTIVWELLDKVTGPLDHIGQSITGAKQSMENAKFSFQSTGDGLEQLGQKAKSSEGHIVGFSDSKTKFQEAAKTIQSSYKDTMNGLEDGNAVIKSAKNEVESFSDELRKTPKNHITELNVESGKAKEQTEKVKRSILGIPSHKKTEIEVDPGNSTERIERVDKATKGLQEHTSSLKGAILGTFAGNLIAGGVSALTNGLESAVEAGKEYNKEQDTMKTVWHSLTEEAPKDGEQLVGFINDLSQHSIYAADSINEMAQGFYHVHSNADETKKWVNDFMALGSTLHLTNAQMEESGEVWTKIQAQGKAGAEDLQMMTNRFPMFGEALQKTMGKSMEEIRKVSADGKLTAGDFEKALDELGEKYKNGTSEAMTSAMGMGMYIKNRFTKLSGDVQASSFEMSKGVQKDIQSILSDDSLAGMANGISGAISQVMTGASRVISYVSDHKDVILDIISQLKNILGILGNEIWTTAKDVISGIANKFNEITGASSSAQDPLKAVDTTLKELGKRKEDIQKLAKVLMGIWATKKIVGFVGTIVTAGKAIKDFYTIAAESKAVTVLTSGLKKAASAAKSFALALTTNPLGIFLIVVTAIGVGLYEAYKHIKPFRDAVNKMGSEIKSWAGNVQKRVKGIGPAFKSLKDTASKNLTGIVTATKKMSKDALKSFTQFSNDVSKSSSKLGKNLEKSWNSISKSTQKSWKLIGNYVSGSIEGASKNSTKYANKIRSDVGTAFEHLRNDTAKIWQKIQAAILDPIEGAWKTAVNYAKRIWSDLMDLFTHLWKETQKIWGRIRSAMTDPIVDAWHSVTKTVSDIYSTVSNYWDQLKSDTIKKWDDMVDHVKDVPHRMGKALSEGAHFVGEGAKDIANYMLDKIGGGVNGVIHGIDWVLDKVNAPKSVRIEDWKVPKYATGGSHPGGLMLVNDGDGPELVRHPDGRMEIPTGKDVLMHAEAGTQVLNHQDTKSFVKQAGIPMYADGIGEFFSGLWDDVKEIGEEVTDAVSHPVEFMKKAIAKHVNIDATHPTLDAGVGAVKTMAKGAEDWIKETIDKYGNELLESMGGGSGSRGQFIKIAEAQSGKPYVWGAEGPDAFDCSGLVKWALEQVGVSFPHYSGSQFSATTAVDEDQAKPGDLAFYGPGGSEHVGIVTGKNKMFAAQSPYSNPNIGPDTIHNGLPFAGIRRINQLNDGEGGGGVAAPGGAGIQRWRGQLKDALKANGLPTTDAYMNAWLSQIATESSGNESALGGNDGRADGNAQGLLQVKPGTFSDNMFPGHGNVWNGYDNMLAAIRYAKNRYGSEGMLAAIGHGHGYQEGGNPKTRQLAWLAEDGEEFVINPRKPNALSLVFNALRSIQNDQPHLAAEVNGYDYTPGSYGSNDGQTGSSYAKSKNGSGISSMLERVINYLEKIADKDPDVYIDGDKVTDKVNRKNTDQLNILKTIQ